MFEFIILGGLLLMMGQHDRSEALFYYFRLEDQVPENHLLRLIEKHLSFAFVREQLKESYSETGRPSIDPGSRDPVPPAQLFGSHTGLRLLQDGNDLFFAKSTLAHDSSSDPGWVILHGEVTFRLD